MGVKRVRVGDVFEIPLSGGRKGFGHYVLRDENEGPLIQVFDLIADGEYHTEQVLERLKNSEPLFPPVIVGVYAAVRRGLWKVVGRLPTDGFQYPAFVSTLYNEKTGQAGIWFLWDGQKTTHLGRELPEEYKHLEFLMVWSPHDVAERIETGTVPFPYGDLIRFNRYVPTGK